MSSVRPPSVSRVLESETGRSIAARHGHDPAVAAIRSVIEVLRRAGDGGEPEEVAVIAARQLAKSDRLHMRPVWNMTGTVLHTNLGRAQLSDSAIAAATAAMARPVALEYDVGEGARGERDDALRDLLHELTGCEASLLVNNNAAAVMLVLDTFARGGEVIVSRGELIEIGGAFRLPDIMERAGVRLREVGTTNRTHLRDYEDAITDETRMILKVHPSNFRIEGFTKEATANELAPLARKHGIPLVNDLGSGTLTDLAQFGLPREPTVREALGEGADIVTFSGDKLLGGPQAGFVIGRAKLIAQMKRNPMKRALRLDKIRLAALEATLRDYRRGVDNPTIRALRRPAGDIAAAAARLAPQISRTLGEGYSAEIVDSESQVGSGASPTATLPSFAISVRSPDSISPDRFTTALRDLPEPVIGRIRGDFLLFDLRALDPAEEAGFLANLAGFSAAQ